MDIAFGSCHRTNPSIVRLTAQLLQEKPRVIYKPLLYKEQKFSASCVVDSPQGSRSTYTEILCDGCTRREKAVHETRARLRADTKHKRHSAEPQTWRG
jgi:hypothetical protein